MIGISFFFCDVGRGEVIYIFNIDYMALFGDNKVYCHNNEGTFSTTRGGGADQEQKITIY